MPFNQQSKASTWPISLASSSASAHSLAGIPSASRAKRTRSDRSLESGPPLSSPNSNSDHISLQQPQTNFSIEKEPSSEEWNCIMGLKHRPFLWLMTWINEAQSSSDQASYANMPTTPKSVLSYGDSTASQLSDSNCAFSSFPIAYPIACPTAYPTACPTAYPTACPTTCSTACSTAYPTAYPYMQDLILSKPTHDQTIPQAASQSSSCTSPSPGERKQLKSKEKLQKKPHLVKKYFCTDIECGIVCTRKADWKKHEVKQHGYPKFCNQDSCNERFHSRKDFDRHRYRSHGCKRSCSHKDCFKEPLVQQRAWGCGFCARTLYSWETRVDHVADHYEKDNTKNDWEHTRMILGLLNQWHHWANLGYDSRSCVWLPEDTVQLQRDLEYEGSWTGEDLALQAWMLLKPKTNDRSCVSSLSLHDSTMASPSFTTPITSTPGYSSSVASSVFVEAQFPSQEYRPTNMVPALPTTGVPFSSSVDTTYQSTLPYNFDTRTVTPSITTVAFPSNYPQSSAFIECTDLQALSYDS